MKNRNLFTLATLVAYTPNTGTASGTATETPKKGKELTPEQKDAETLKSIQNALKFKTEEVVCTLLIPTGKGKTASMPVKINLASSDGIPAFYASPTAGMFGGVYALTDILDPATKEPTGNTKCKPATVSQAEPLRSALNPPKASLGLRNRNDSAVFSALGIAMPETFNPLVITPDVVAFSEYITTALTNAGESLETVTGFSYHKWQDVITAGKGQLGRELLPTPITTPSGVVLKYRYWLKSKKNSGNQVTPPISEVKEPAQNQG